MGLIYWIPLNTSSSESTSIRFLLRKKMIETSSYLYCCS